MPGLHLCDLAVGAQDPNALPTATLDFPLISLPWLRKLSLQLPGLDGHLLRALHTPLLQEIRILSAIPIRHWPVCEDDHFPSLSVANISCRGPSATRIRALGVQEHRFAHSLSRFDNWTNDHSLPFVVHLQPSNNRRISTPTLTPSLEASPTLTWVSDSEGNEEGTHQLSNAPPALNPVLASPTIPQPESALILGPQTQAVPAAMETITTASHHEHVSVASQHLPDPAADMEPLASQGEEATVASQHLPTSVECSSLIMSTMHTLSETAEPSPKRARTS
ncbi:hypothetical protein CF326_g1937 [Tilletia indica]|nr:hypothetical protein CF326_g1937 [Tilletia indica]